MHQCFHDYRSVESFERKLEETQKALNIDPRDYVPVMYIDETNHAKTGRYFCMVLQYWLVNQTADDQVKS